MSYSIRISLIAMILLVGALMAFGAVQAALAMRASSDQLAGSSIPTPTPLPNQMQASSPEISFIDSPTASCILPEMNTGVCFMTWNFMYANADPNYMVTMTVSIDNKLRARYSGFFQTSMVVPSEMMTFQVQCGAPGSGGDPYYGAVHSYILRARDSAGLSAANYGSVTCPADLARVFLPFVKR
jgi:hypothetical protein